MNISKLPGAVQDVAGRVSQTVGNAVQGKTPKTKFLSKAFDKFEANGGDNSFFGLATIMGLFVVVPRVKSALKRNPGNKEATKDEIMEILFRDLQTIAIILFGLKSMNSVIANISTKVSGIPMVNKPYKNVFGKGAEGIGERIKNFGSNILTTLNPIGGSMSLNGKQIDSLYSQFPDRNSVVKLLNETENRGGRQESVFAKIKESVINSLNNKIELNNNASHFTNNQKSNQEAIDILQGRKEYFSNLSLKDFMQEGFVMDKDCEAEMLEALSKKDKTNALSFSAKVVNSLLKTLALGIEVAYLGFGLPALNQKRLEKKYLSEKPIGTQEGDTFCPINDKHIKAQEIKLYSNFMK